MAFEDLLSTKATGKAQAQSGPGQSNIAEQMAQQQAQEQIGDVQEQGQLADQQQEAQKGAIEEEGKTQQRGLDFADDERQVAEMEQVQGLLQKAEFSDVQLEDRQDALALETSAHKLMMQDQAYVQQLREVGRRGRLTDEITFNEELDRQVYGEDLSMLMDELGWLEGQGAIARDRADDLFNMEVDVAMAIAAADTKQAGAQMIGQGVLDAGTAAGGYYADQTKKEPTTTQTEELSEQLFY